MGVLAPGSAHARPSAQPPIDTNGNFSAHMSWRGANFKLIEINLEFKYKNKSSELIILEDVHVQFFDIC